MQYASNELLLDIEDYLLERYEEPKPENHILFQTVYSCVETGFDTDMTINDIVEKKVETFQDKLFQLIQEKNIDEVEMYKKGNISRQLFSKIKSKKDYYPRKDTVFSLAIGMELSIDETSELLSKAGYVFNSSCKPDLIIQYFMYHKNYNIFAINEVLDKYGYKTL